MDEALRYWAGPPHKRAGYTNSSPRAALGRLLICGRLEIGHPGFISAPRAADANLRAGCQRGCYHGITSTPQCRLAPTQGDENPQRPITSLITNRPPDAIRPHESDPAIQVGQVLSNRSTSRTTRLQRDRSSVVVKDSVGRRNRPPPRRGQKGWRGAKRVECRSRCYNSELDRPQLRGVDSGLPENRRYSRLGGVCPTIPPGHRRHGDEDCPPFRRGCAPID